MLPPKNYQRHFRCPPCKAKRAYCNRSSPTTPCDRCIYYKLEKQCLPAAPAPRKGRHTSPPPLSLSHTSTTTHLSFSSETRSLIIHLISLGFPLRGDNGYVIRTFFGTTKDEFIARCSDFFSPVGCVFGSAGGGGRRSAAGMGKWGEELAWLCLAAGSKYKGNGEVESESKAAREEIGAETGALIGTERQDGGLLWKVGNKHSLWLNLSRKALQVVSDSQMWDARDGADGMRTYAILFFALGFLQFGKSLILRRDKGLDCHTLRRDRS
jgi:hypothetical protein